MFLFIFPPPSPEPLTLTHKETYERIGISERWFYELKAAGAFEDLASRIPGRYSREKVDAFCANRPTHPYARSA